MSQSKSMSWYVGESAEPTLSLDKGSQTVIGEYETHGTMTMSRTAGMIVECYLPLDDMLNTIEEEVDSEIDDIGLPLPDYMRSDFFPQPISQQEWNELSTYRHQYSLPSEFVEQLDEVVGERTKSRWMIAAVRDWEKRPYDTRQERIEAKRDYLQLARDERQTPHSRVMRLVRESGGEILPDMYDRIWGDGVEVASLAEVSNWREVGMDANIVLTEPLSEDMDVDWSNCKQTYKHYAAAIVAAIRGMSDEYPINTAWVVDCIHSTLDESDYICDRTTERVVDYIDRVHSDWITNDLVAVEYQDILARYNNMSGNVAEIAYKLDHCKVDTSWIGYDGDKFVAIETPDTDNLDSLDITFDNVRISSNTNIGRSLSKFAQKYHGVWED